jgi:hypothetical protein
MCLECQMHSPEQWVRWSMIDDRHVWIAAESDRVVHPITEPGYCQRLGGTPHVVHNKHHRHAGMMHNGAQVRQKPGADFASFLRWLLPEDFQ